MLLQRKRSATSHVPSTALRAVPLPLSRSTSESVPAMHLHAGFAKATARKPFVPPQKREAERRQAHLPMSAPRFFSLSRLRGRVGGGRECAAGGHTNGCCQPSALGARSPLGAPRRRLARRLERVASAQAALHAIGRERRLSPAPSNALTAKHLAHRSSCRQGRCLDRPGARLRAPPAGTALAPAVGRHRSTPLGERDSGNVT